MTEDPTRTVVFRPLRSGAPREFAQIMDIEDRGLRSSTGGWNPPDALLTANSNPGLLRRLKVLAEKKQPDSRIGL